MSKYLAIQISEGNPPVLSFHSSLDEAVKTFLDYSLELGKWVQSTHLYEVSEDNSHRTLSSISWTDGEYYNIMTKGTWYPEQRFDVTLETMDEDGEMSFYEFVMEGITS